MSYVVITTSDAELDIEFLKRSNPASARKALALMEELVYHPRNGTGHPEPLKGYVKETWSRKISKKDRLVYVIEDNIVTVTVVSALGHYGDK